MRKKELPIILPLILCLLITLPGCFENKKITGPKWTTSFTIPLINRAKNTADPSQSTELILGSGTNGSGQKGLSLTTAGSYTQTLDGIGSSVGTIIVNLNSITNISMSGYPVTGSYTIPTSPAISTPDFTFSGNISSYSSVTLSASPSQPSYNTIEISLTGMSGDAGGLKFELKNASNTTIRSATVTSGQSSAALDLSGVTFSPSPYHIQVSGDMKITNTGTAGISFTTNDFEVGQFTINSGQSINLDTHYSDSFDLSTTLDQVTLGAAILKFTSTMPNNLELKAKLTITPNIGSAVTKDITVTSTDPAEIDIKDEINNIFTASPTSIQISIDNVTLHATNNVTVNSLSSIILNPSFTLALGSVTTEVEGTSVDSSTDTDDVDSVVLRVEVTNTSEFQLETTIDLYPTSNITDTTNAVNFSFVILPKGTKPSELKITGTQFQNLIKNGMIYHVIKVDNQSASNAVIGPNDYLEIHARFEGKVKVNQ